MAWMRMMGTDSVEYHRQTIIERADDHPGAALAYYASRGETPLSWGGEGAKFLGLTGAVTDHQYESIFGPGGAMDPTLGERLVRTRRPGMELVVAAHKSVAELGVIGHVEQMHEIMDAERDATLGYLDQVTRRRGGRRGSAAIASPTSGLIYASTRHATSRAGDPAPHDHVLLANLVRMTDGEGGWKAADTTVWREHLHAATVIGRLAGARKAVELGYAIEADDGPSGKLGHWRLAGIPEEVCERHSKRSAQIEAELERTGYDSYRARGIAARASRDHKRHGPIDDLMAHWKAELGEVDWTVPKLSLHLARTNRSLQIPEPMERAEVKALAAEVLSPEGPLARAKVFSRKDVIVATGPKLFGRTEAEVTQIIESVMADPEVIPLLSVAGAKERVYATASTLALEDGIAEAVELGAHSFDRTRIRPDEAIATVEARRGYSLSPEQAGLVHHIATDGRGVDLVVGVAGSGKTTALEALAEAWKAQGLRALGTATSGQAARNLGTEANVDSSTVASLTRQLDSGRLTLGPGDLLLIDEAGMTEDRDLFALLNAAGAAKAHVVMVGDPHQLSAVGPGGAMEAAMARHPGVHVLAENRRQRDVAERVALAELRNGTVEEAVSFYLHNDRVVTNPDRHDAMARAVGAYLADRNAGKDSLLLAWRRAHVAEMNALAREALQSQGLLSRTEMEAPGGTRYALDDKVVFTAPNHDAGVVTSQTATVFLTDNAPGTSPALVLALEDGRRIRLEGEAIDGSHLAHGYAMTVHRCQGATVDTAHVLGDGGGRELGYVAMSRAKEESHLYVVADDLAQAQEDLVRDWGESRRSRWAIDTGTPAPGVVADEVIEARAYPGLARARAAAEAAAIAAVIPPGVDSETSRRARVELDKAKAIRAGVEHGYGKDPSLGHAYENLKEATAEAEAARRALEETRVPAGHLLLRHQAERAQAGMAEAQLIFDTVAEPHRAAADRTLEQAQERLAQLGTLRNERDAFDRDHPEAARRLDVLSREAGREPSTLVRDHAAELGEVETLGGPSMAASKSARASEQAVELHGAEAILAGPGPNPNLAHEWYLAAQRALEIDGPSLGL